MLYVQVLITAMLSCSDTSVLFAHELPASESSRFPLTRLLFILHYYKVIWSSESISIALISNLIFRLRGKLRYHGKTPRRTCFKDATRGHLSISNNTFR